MCSSNHINIAVQGCSHGMLNKIYSQVEFLEKSQNLKIDLLICCGDFQAIRNYSDLACMAVPLKYKQLGDFSKYYFEEKQAPVKTIFVGGNHEASNYLWELPYGGWVAPNIYYMGYSNRIIYKGVYIAGISGIYKPYHYSLNHFEKPPFTSETIRTIYHSRSVDVFRLSLLPRATTDIFLSHDWPTNVYNYGDTDRLLKLKPFFKSEIFNNSLGDPNKFDLMKKIEPKRWFSAHLHCDYEAKIPITNSSDSYIHFQALDKFRPNKSHLELITIDLNEYQIKNFSDDHLYYDPYWLSIIKKTQSIIPCSNEKTTVSIPISKEFEVYQPEDNDIKKINDLFENNLQIPLNFKKNVHFDRENYVINNNGNIKCHEVFPLFNIQTSEFCDKLNIMNPCSNGNSTNHDQLVDFNPDEIDLS